jgi:hypothetical protein
MARTWTAVLARMGVPTGDGRILAEGGITSRDLPLPLLWQPETSDGHGGSIVVGRMESINFANSMAVASGSLLDSTSSMVEELIDAGVVGPSVDLDDLEYVMDTNDQIVITKGRIAGATLVPIPAFADVSITLDPRPVEPVTVPEPQPEAMFASAAAPEALPAAEWFMNPKLSGLTPLTVTSEGRVFGHMAGWGTCHVGLPGCVTPPASQSDYAYFHVGEQQTAEGAAMPVGTLTVGGGHADAQLGFRAAAEHYDNVGAAVAKVTAGEDEYGIWVSGWMLPTADPVRREQFMSSPVSGDWRRIGGGLEMIAVCSVNSPGFPVPRARVAFSKGAQRALVGTFGARPVAGAAPGPETINDKDAAAAMAWSLAARQSVREN